MNESLPDVLARLVHRSNGIATRIEDALDGIVEGHNTANKPLFDIGVKAMRREIASLKTTEES